MATMMSWLGHDKMNMVMYCYRPRDESAQQAMTKFRIQPSNIKGDNARNVPTREWQDSAG